MYVVRKRLAASEGQPPNTRYNPECDCIEITVDGGATWNEAPGSDPRISPAYLLPPLTGEDARCAAAAGMTAAIEQYVDSIGETTSIVGVANSILALIAVFIPITLLGALIWAIADALLVIGGAVISAAFTEDVYDQLRQIFYCAISEDGSVTAGQLEEVRAQISGQIGGAVVPVVTDLFFQATGHVGMSNAGVKYAQPDAECDPCPQDWCNVWQGGGDPDLTEWSIYSPYGSYSGGAVLNWTNGSVSAILINITAPAGGQHFIGAEITAECSGLGINNGIGLYGATDLISPVLPLENGTHTYIMPNTSGDTSNGTFQVNLYSNDSPATMLLTVILLYGDGTGQPWYVSNCTPPPE